MEDFNIPTAYTFDDRHDQTGVSRAFAATGDAWFGPLPTDLIWQNKSSYDSLGHLESAADALPPLGRMPSCSSRFKTLRPVSLSNHLITARAATGPRPRLRVGSLTPGVL